MGDKTKYEDENLELTANVDGIDVRVGTNICNKQRIIIVLIFLVLIVGCVTTILCYAPSNETKSDKTLSIIPWKDIRLPESIVPNTYDLVLDVNMSDDTFRGAVDINVIVSKDTVWILFHKVELRIVSVRVLNTRTKHVSEILKMFYYQPNEFYVLQTKTPLKKGENYDIIIKFTGTIGYELSGLYTSYVDVGKQRSKVVSTFFSPISARKAFPCFDEPMFKANFTLTLTHSDIYHALSNMPAKSTVYSNDQVTTNFYTTLRMSTYIVCWVISDFESIETANSTDTKLKAWAAKNSKEDLRYGLETTGKLLRFYEKYFNISFPLKKLDTIAIPNLGPGAMENWGIITYRSQIILYSENTSTEADRQQAFNIIAHELVHQWFGNLVTMEFWSDAWLKEGFANNIAIVGGDRVDKTMGLGKQVLTSLMLRALDVDSYSSSHPISTSVQTPSDIREVFNVITYNKGSCIVEILSQFLGANNFRKGLQKYLKTYSYKNANQDNLWEQLSSVSGKDVKSVMDTWTLQLGYPVISASRINNTYLEIKQQRFSLDPPDIIPPTSPFNYTWKVPIVFVNPFNKKRKTYLLESESASLNIPEEYSVINPDHSLFYRVHYDKEMLESIKSILLSGRDVLTPQDRTGILSDQFNFVNAGLTDIKSTLDIYKYLKDERDYFPWKVALDSLSFIKSLVDDKNMRIKFDTFVRNLTSKITKRVNWGNPTSANEGSLQIRVLKFACEHDAMGKVKQAKDLYLNWINGKGMNVRPSLYPVVRDCAISHGPESYWNYAFAKFREGGVLKDSLLMSLTTTRRISTIKKLLAYSLDNSIIETQDAPYLIAELAQRSSMATRLCWRFIKDNWDKIMKIYGNELFLLANMLQSVLENISSQKELDEIEMFFSNIKDLGSGKQAVKQSINKIKSNIQWKKKHLANLSSWLKALGF